MAKRPYRLSKRALTRQATRQKIVEATVRLHRTVGPARTTIAAIAEQAGVQRLTVYRHFPEPRDLFQACGARFRELHPPPSTDAWRAIRDPRERIRPALTQLYIYYADTADMRANVERDEPALPELAEAASGFATFLEEAAAVLAEGWQTTAAQRRILHAAISHALAFSTWRSLAVGQRLTTDEAAGIMTEFIRCAPRRVRSS